MEAQMKFVLGVLAVLGGVTVVMTAAFVAMSVAIDNGWNPFR
jgi:hypothetical protein